MSGELSEALTEALTETLVRCYVTSAALRFASAAEDASAVGRDVVTVVLEKLQRGGRKDVSE